MRWIAILLLALAGCYTTPPSPEHRLEIRVINDSRYDAKVYVISGGGGRTRAGYVGAENKETLNVITTSPDQRIYFELPNKPGRAFWASERLPGDYRCWELEIPPYWQRASVIQCRRK